MTLFPASAHGTPIAALLVSLAPRRAGAATFRREGGGTPIDIRTRDGWRHFETLLTARTTHDVDQRALAALREDLADVSHDARTFMTLLFTPSKPITTVGQLARQMQVQPSTLASQFGRLGLPTPSRYLIFARVVRIAGRLEQGASSIAAVIAQLRHGSARAFRRQARTVLGATPTQFRACTGADVLERFRQELLVPYREPLSRLCLPRSSGRVTTPAGDGISDDAHAFMAIDGPRSRD